MTLTWRVPVPFTSLAQPAERLLLRRKAVAEVASYHFGVILSDTAIAGHIITEIDECRSFAVHAPDLIQINLIHHTTAIDVTEQ